MAEYVTTFTKPYPSGYQDLPSEATPVGHEIIESWENAIVSLESYLSENNIPEVSASTTVKSGTKTATITIDGTEYIIYSPSVSYESAITGGTKVGTITVGANTFDVYTPTSSAGGSTVSVVPKTLTGTNIAEITVDGTTYQLYAPTGGSTVTAEATLTEGTQIGKITVDGVETILYAPTAGAITVDAELSATSENPVQNKVVKAEFDKVNSNLDGLSYGFYSGGKNLLNINDIELTSPNYWFDNIYVTLKPNTYYCISYTSTSSGYYQLISDEFGIDDVNNMSVGRNTIIFYTNSNTNGKFRLYINGTGTFSNFMLEEGTQATEYEPYIPSVKMLADEVSAQKNDLTKKTENKILAKGSEWTGTLESLGSNIDVSVMINGGNATDRPSGASLYGYYSSKTLNGGGSYCQYLDFANKKYYVKMWIGASNNDTGWIALN